MKTRTLCVLLTCGLIGSACRGADEPEPLRLIKTIPMSGVRGRFDHFAEDAEGHQLFLAALGNNSIEVLDTRELTRKRSISGLKHPTGVAFLPSEKTAFAASSGDGTLRRIEESSARTIVSGLPDADNLRWHGPSKKLWIGYGSGKLAWMPAGASSVEGSVALDAHPESFQLEKQGHRLFVNLPDSRQIAVVDTRLNQIVGRWPMHRFGSNFPMALDEPNHRLFVGFRDPPQLSAYDTETGKSRFDVEISGDTDDLFWDVRRNRLYVSCGDGFVDVIDVQPESARRRARIPTRRGSRTSWFSPETRLFFLAVPEIAGSAAEVRVFKAE